VAIRFVYFDCMETLVQIEIPSIEIYPEWAYGHAAKLGLWEGLEAFRSDWTVHREQFLSWGGGLKEGTILGRIRDILAERAERAGNGWTPARVDQEARRIHEGYWGTYRSATHVLPEVPETLEDLRARRIPLGVVSNFMVPGGIPDLLGHHGLARFFGPVVVSCDLGWRKPSEKIFQAAIDAAGVEPGEILFIGDTLAADYIGPMAMGMRPLLYDPKGAHPEIRERIGSFREIGAWLAG
jgi:putative hydrolase of the HAD superfamily